MALPTIYTKLCIPQARPLLVARPRLLEKINSGLQGKLTLVSAPAGFGKTTLLVDWLRTCRRKVAWITLDETDNDPVRFLFCFISALQQIDPKIGKATQSLLLAPEPPPPGLLMTTLLNEIGAISQPFILVIDDYHLIQTQGIHSQLGFIVDHQPAQMHLVLATREDPPLPLPRLLARSQMTEIRQRDLRFTTQETAAFLKDIMQLDIALADIAALERRTEGWIAGLQLAALSMQERDDPSQFVQHFTASNRYILDYLISEVLERLPADLQDFMLKTSILDRMSGALCDVVTERTGSQKLLISLEQANLFIFPCDQSRSWYRYHRLFGELLRNRLRSQDGIQEATLHQLACQWYEAESLLSEAIPHALAGSDWEKVEALTHKLNTSLLQRGEIFTLLGWYNQIPQDVLLSRPQLCLDYCWPLILSGQIKEAAFYLEKTEQEAELNHSLRGQVLTAKAFLARSQGDMAQLVKYSQKALALLPKGEINPRCILTMNLGIASWHSGNMQASETAFRETLETAQIVGNHYAYLTALVFQGMICAVRGQLRKAQAIFEQVVEQEPPLFLLGLANLYLGVLQYEWNNLEESAGHLLEATQTGERLGHDELLVSAWIMTGRLHLASQNIPAVSDLLQRSQHQIREGNVPPASVARLAALQVQWALAQDDLPEALFWSDQLADGADWHSFYRFFNLTRAHLLLAQDKREEASVYLERLYEQAALGSWRYGMIAVRVLQAQAAQNPSAALDYLTEALRSGQPEGFMRTFVDAGKGLKPLLEEAARHRDISEYVKKILAVMDGKPVISFASPTHLVEPLSERELEVLQLLVEGMTNREIAERLYISTGTAKTHVHNICGKLSARNRTEAVVRASELNLL